MADAKWKQGEREIHFWVPGIPRSTQTGSVIRVRQPNGKDRLIPTRRNTPWSATVGLVARSAYRGRPLAGPVLVRLVFNVPRPKGAKAGVTYPTTRPDLENLAKGLLDSWNGVLYADDSQVARLELEKAYALGDSVGVAVTVVSIQPRAEGC